MARVLTAIDPERVRANLGAVRGRIASAAHRSGRDPARIELLAATKYVPNDLMGALADAGVTLAGENTAQSLIAKHDRWGDRFAFDFIGRLQSRKVKDVLSVVRLIHSLSTESALARIEQRATRQVEALLQVNIAHESSKQGVAPTEVDRFLEAAAATTKVVFKGLMTMPPIGQDPEACRPHFAALRALADRLEDDWAPRHSFDVLSMGTSQDYEVAVEEGATIVRLGNVLYG